MPKLQSGVTSMTAILTPSMYPTEKATHISILAKFHILNSISMSVLIVIAALITNWFTMDDLTWSNAPLAITNSSSLRDLNRTVIETTVSSLNMTQTSLTDTKTPLLLSYGVLPPILVASVLYIVIVVLVMGKIRPGFLELPPSQYSSRRASIAKKSQSSDEGKLATVEEEEKLTNGLIVNNIEEIKETKTLTPKSDNKSSNEMIQDVKYMNILDGKETDL